MMDTFGALEGVMMQRASAGNGLSGSFENRMMAALNGQDSQGSRHSVGSVGESESTGSRHSAGSNGEAESAPPLRNPFDDEIVEEFAQSPEVLTPKDRFAPPPSPPGPSSPTNVLSVGVAPPLPPLPQHTLPLSLLREYRVPADDASSSPHSEVVASGGARQEDDQEGLRVGQPHPQAEVEATVQQILADVEEIATRDERRRDFIECEAEQREASESPIKPIHVSELDSGSVSDTFTNGDSSAEESVSGETPTSPVRREPITASTNANGPAPVPSPQVLTDDQQEAISWAANLGNSNVEAANLGQLPEDIERRKLVERFNGIVQHVQEDVLDLLNTAAPSPPVSSPVSPSNSNSMESDPKTPTSEANSANESPRAGKSTSAGLRGIDATGDQMIDESTARRSLSPTYAMARTAAHMSGGQRRQSASSLSSTSSRGSAAVEPEAILSAAAAVGKTPDEFMREMDIVPTEPLHQSKNVEMLLDGTKQQILLEEEAQRRAVAAPPTSIQAGTPGFDHADSIERAQPLPAERSPFSLDQKTSSNSGTYVEPRWDEGISVLDSMLPDPPKNNFDANMAPGTMFGTMTARLKKNFKNISGI